MGWCRVRDVEVAGYSKGNLGFLMSLNPESLLLRAFGFKACIACNLQVE